ncbi:MAG: hypothetical protein WBK96_01680 [Candidatus Manganitrophaceae bacterium]
MPKVNFIIEEGVQTDLVKMIPRRQRSKLVNEAIKKELRRIKRVEALSNLINLRKKTATRSSREIEKSLNEDRKRS